jgi:hypothetical protein
MMMTLMMPVHAFVDEHQQVSARYTTANKVLDNAVSVGNLIGVLAMFRGNPTCSGVSVSDDQANVYSVLLPCTNNGGASGETEIIFKATALTTSADAFWTITGNAPPVNQQNFAQVITFCATSGGVNCSVGAISPGATNPKDSGTSWQSNSIVTTYTNSLIWGGAMENTGGVSFSSSPAWDTFGNSGCDTQNCFDSGLTHSGPGSSQPNIPIRTTVTRTWSPAGAGNTGVSFLVEIRDPAGAPPATLCSTALSGEIVGASGIIVIVIMLVGVILTKGTDGFTGVFNQGKGSKGGDESKEALKILVVVACAILIVGILFAVAQAGGPC